MRTIHSPESWRNMGFINEVEQETILAGSSTSVAIGGVGGGGFELGLKLARLGVQTFDIADPEDFERVNINRVEGAKRNTVGRNKAEVFEEEVHNINPDADVRIYKDGVTPDNVDEFMSRATLVFDETELSMPQVGTLICRKARERKLPVVNVNFIGFAGQVTSFHPESKTTFERFMGIPEDMPLDEVAQQKLEPSRYLAYLPKYGDLRTLVAVQEGAPLPSLGVGVDVASALGQSEALFHMLKDVSSRRPQPTWAPRVRWMDAYTNTAGETSHPRLSYYRHLAHAVGRYYLGLNEKASYTESERVAREQEPSA